jgi:hypothetical protein
LEEWEGGSTVASSEQKSAIAAEMWRVGWEERRRLRYCDSIWEEMSRPVAWVMWVFRACWFYALYQHLSCCIALSTLERERE